ncbi:potassium transporter Kup [Glycomyces artemisiae]|uniref:Probable potassium transport system protein Kup n=1 Tax=Glycomyces artemisiae TaxID=1076443 RepID=A0A2T0URQ4_9ACTN|nr:KUP/HAK/KT family potassium transporter [Glycomyces artemisiae]PRY60594.1 KUP system potassium uptake protein [Glycomyces artemisiae]
MTAAGSAGQPGPATDTAPQPGHGVRDATRLALVVGALGVVFGDIGTSPIYALQTVFNPADPHPVPVAPESIYGVVSLMFWSMVIIVTVTYVLLAMRIDNDGEGGIMALITLLHKWKQGRGRRAALTLAALGIFGASLFLGDSMITPAISVLSAIEGIEVVEPRLDSLVIPLTALIIVVLFLVQRKGTAVVGRAFGPVMIVWFGVLAVLGIRGIGGHPEILKALSPYYAAHFLFDHFHIAFFALAAIVLCVTGAEALYADMGHFGRPAITKAWLILVFPALLLNYMGQGAMILEDGAAVSGPFFLLAPGWARLPLLLLATAATIIAAQAVITGAYSVAAQASRLGYLPRLRIDHTSAEQYGQIYVPWINWLLMVSVLTLVFAFRSSHALAYAYGMAVMGTITIMTLLFLYIAKSRWQLPLWLVVGGGAVLIGFDLLFLAANFTKLVHGAWLPLLIGLAAFTVMVTWQKGRAIVTAERERREGPLRACVKQLRAELPKTNCVSGTAVFLNRGKLTTPLALRANMEHNHVRHKQIVIASIETQPVPRVGDEDRVKEDFLGFADDGIVYVQIRFGYMEVQDVPRALAQLDRAGHGGRLHIGDASYFLSTIHLHASEQPTMAQWRKHLFIATSRITADAADHFRLPRERTIIMGSQIEV